MIAPRRRLLHEQGQRRILKNVPREAPAVVDCSRVLAGVDSAILPTRGPFGRVAAPGLRSEDPETRTDPQRALTGGRQFRWSRNCFRGGGVAASLRRCTPDVANGGAKKHGPLQWVRGQEMIKRYSGLLLGSMLASSPVLPPSSCARTMSRPTFPVRGRNRAGRPVLGGIAHLPRPISQDAGDPDRTVQGFGRGDHSDLRLQDR